MLETAILIRIHDNPHISVVELTRIFFGDPAPEDRTADIPDRGKVYPQTRNANYNLVNRKIREMVAKKLVRDHGRMEVIPSWTGRKTFTLTEGGKEVLQAHLERLGRFSLS